jgi:hypothetical protein
MKEGDSGGRKFFRARNCRFRSSCASTEFIPRKNYGHVSQMSMTRHRSLPSPLRHRSIAGGIESFVAAYATGCVTYQAADAAEDDAPTG